MKLIGENAENILGKINGLYPSPGAWFIFKGERYKILKAELSNATGEPGVILNDNFEIGCANNSLRILEIQRQGKNIQKISGELGDIAMSLPYMQSESKNLNRDLEDHMMHLLAHGILHLLGFDHTEDQDANIMEAQEIKYLKFFKIANPYLI